MENVLTRRTRVEQGTGTTVIYLDVFGRIEYICGHADGLTDDSSLLTFYPSAQAADWHLTKYYYATSSASTYCTKIQRKGTLTAYSTFFPAANPY